MKKEFLFLSGRIDAMGSKMASLSQLERMIMAKSPSDAFRILAELQYADLFDDSTRPQDFLNIINQGLQETKKLITDGTDNDQVFEFIWKQFDLNNIKRALKIKLVDQENEISDFSVDNGFNWLGTLNSQDIFNIVFCNKNYKKVPREYRLVIGGLEDYSAEETDFREVEFKLDKAHFDFLNRIAKGIPFLKNWLKLMADMTNIKSVARSIFVLDGKFTKNMFLPYGDIAFSKLNEVKSLQDLEEVFVDNELFSLENILSERNSAEENILILEKSVGKIIDDFLEESAADSLGGIEVPLVYLHKRIKNARKIKLIMLSKFYGIDPETIYENVKNF